MSHSLDPETTAWAAEHHSYFVPMVDMLAGVIFILVILLTSTALVSRETFQKSTEAQIEIEAIERKLAEARAMERHVLEPRRDAKAAARVLLSRLHQALADTGVASVSHVAEMKLTIPFGSKQASSISPVRTPTDERIVGILAQVLRPNLPCLSGARPSAQICDAYPPARLESITVAVRPGDAGASFSAAETLALGTLARLAERDPELLSYTGTDGESLFRYRGFDPASDISGIQTENRSGVLSEGTSEIVLQFSVPPPPPG